MTGPLLSRSGRSDPGGKCDVRVDVPCTPELAERLTALAALAGKTRSEYVRDLLNTHVYGEFVRIQRIVRAGSPVDHGTNER